MGKLIENRKIASPILQMTVAMVVATKQESVHVTVSRNCVVSKEINFKTRM